MASMNGPGRHRKRDESAITKSAIWVIWNCAKLVRTLLPAGSCRSMLKWVCGVISHGCSPPLHISSRRTFVVGEWLAGAAQHPRINLQSDAVGARVCRRKQDRACARRNEEEQGLVGSVNRCCPRKMRYDLDGGPPYRCRQKDPRRLSPGAPGHLAGNRANSRSQRRHSAHV